MWSKWRKIEKYRTINVCTRSEIIFVLSKHIWQRKNKVNKSECEKKPATMVSVSLYKFMCYLFLFHSWNRANVEIKKKTQSQCTVGMCYHLLGELDESVWRVKFSIQCDIIYNYVRAVHSSVCVFYVKYYHFRYSRVFSATFKK